MTGTQGGSRTLFLYVQSGCVTCSDDDIGLPRASNVGGKECVSLMAESCLVDTQFETVCARGLCSGGSALS